MLVAKGRGGGSGVSTNGKLLAESKIKDVWAANLYEEFITIRQIVKKYPIIAMDTEFPGIVARPIGEFQNASDYNYQLLRSNVDLLKLIQLGLTFMDEEGNTPEGICTWQFNFQFSIVEDMFAFKSIELLELCGIKFKRHEQEGIDAFTFAELLIPSGLLHTDTIKWISFHSCYDFGYLLKILMGKTLPDDEASFSKMLKHFFPNIYDIKYIMMSCDSLWGGLQSLADQLEIERIGGQHQAGSDSLLTGMSFFAMKKKYFDDNIDEAKYNGRIYGFHTETMY